MKLAIVTEYPESNSKLANYGYHLVKNFRQNPSVTEIMVVAEKGKTEKAQQFKEDGCLVSIHPCWNHNGYSNILKVSRSVQQFKPDAVFFNLGSNTFGNKILPSILGFMMPIVQKLKGVNTISLLHDLPKIMETEHTISSKISIKKKKYESLLMRLVLNSDVVAVNQNKTLEYLEKAFGAKNVTKIAYGSFEVPPEPNLKPPTSKKQLLVFGELFKQMNPDIVIDALQRLRKRDQKLDIELNIVDTLESDVRNHLKEMQSKYHVVEQVNIHQQVSDYQMNELLEESCLVVLPYKSATKNVQLVEKAARYGKAIVIPYFSQMFEMLEEQRYKCEVYTPNDAESLSEAIENILVFSAYQAHLGMANYKAVCASPINEVADTYIDYFKAIEQSKSKKINISQK